MAVPIQQQIKKIWQQQSNTQRLVLITLVIAAAILIPVMINWASTPTYAVAFSGLSEADAGQVVQKLEEAKITYQLRGTDTILVPSNKVYDVRLQMANAGLPSSGTVGFELFSGNTLGMTDFTQRVNYQRALEGELERTIGSLAAVESVRVHLVTPEKTLLEADQQPATASVTVKQRGGRSLDGGQVESITRLVASSVEGLKADNVTVVDTDGNLLSSGEGSGEGANLARSDSRRAAEQAAANEIQKKVQGLLDSVLGPNHSVVKASVAMDWTQREVTSKAINPTESVVISSQKSNEQYTTNGGSKGGVPGASSNLPTPKATVVVSGGGNSNYTRTDETFNYEVSKTESHEVYAPGQVKAVSLSVLVDGELDAAKLKTLKSAVSAAAGIDEKRGDKLVVEKMTFTPVADAATTAAAAEAQKTQQTETYIRYGVYAAAALLTLAMLWYIMRLFRNLKLATSDTWITVMKPVTELAGGAPMAGALAGASAAAALPSSFPSDAAGLAGGLSAMVGSSFPTPDPTPAPEPYKPPEPKPVAYPEDEQRQRVISRLTEENPASVAEIIQMWLSEDEKRNG